MSDVVQRAVDSAPSSGRDFKAEIDDLMKRAEEARRGAENIDLDGAVAAALGAVSSAADAALERNVAAADKTRTKISDQQERFKAGIVAEGGSLDEEVIGFQRAGNSALPPPTGNKYRGLMDKKRVLQEQGRQSAPA